MAFEEVLQLLAKREALEAKRAEVMRLSMLATAEMLASGEVAPGDPELVAVAARAEAHGLATVRAAAEQAEQDARMAARYAAEPGGEAVAEAMRRQAARAAALGALAEYYAAFMGAVGSLADPDSDSEDDDSEAVNSI